MFGYIRGDLAMIEEGVITVDVHGLGIRIMVGESLIGSLPAIGNEVKIHTYTYVREDGFSLIGFRTKEELDLFKQLITVTGVGPKAGLSFLSCLDPVTLRFAIASADVKTLSKVPGIGKKTAERIVLELKDKISPDMPAGEEGIRLLAGDASGEVAEGNQKDAVQALVALGYSPTEAAKAVRLCEPDPSMSADDILKQSLRFLL